MYHVINPHVTKSALNRLELETADLRISPTVLCYHLPHIKSINFLYPLFRFDGFTGDLLLQYKVMMKSAPEYFYSSLDTKLKLDLVSSLKFAKALNTLAGKCMRNESV